MSAQLKMVGIVVEYMARSLAFYRSLGLDIPRGAEEQGHVEVEIGGGVVLFWDAVFAGSYDPDRDEPKGGHRILPEFFVESEREVDASMGNSLPKATGDIRHPSRRTSEHTWRMVEDPDGNTVLLTGG